MRQLDSAIDHIIESDPVLLAKIGYDDQEQPKVYPAVAPQGTTPPWIVWQIVPGAPPLGHYHDEDAIRPVAVLFKVWSDVRKDAWDLWEALDLALDDPDIEVEMLPWTNLFIKRLDTPGETYEEETRRWGVSGNFVFSVAR